MSGQQTFVGVYSKNRAECDMTSLACCCYSMVVVPLYDTLGADSATYIINEAGIKVIVCDSVEKMKKLLENAESTQTLKYIIVFDLAPTNEPVSYNIYTSCCVEVEFHASGDERVC